MREVVGLPCVLCRQPLGSIFDGVFCAECGGPYHHKCFGKAPATKPTVPCRYCGGDVTNAQAAATREVRSEQLHPTSASPKGGGLGQVFGVVRGFKFLLGGVFLMVVGGFMAFTPGMRYKPDQLTLDDMGPGITMFVAGGIMSALGVYFLRQK